MSKKVTAIKLESLSKTLIQQQLTQAANALVKQWFLLDTIDSSNRFLLQSKPIINGSICLTDQQTAGRGRKGDVWLSPPGYNIYCSVLWQFADYQQLQGLSLAIGLTIVQTLINLGYATIGLKWPNDLLWQRQKLGGILVENKGLDCVVIGFGINRYLPSLLRQTIAKPCTDLITIQPDLVIERNQLISCLLNTVLPLLASYQGFAAYQRLWNDYDQLIGENLVLKTNGKQYQGINLGVNESGGLLLQCQNNVHTFYSGELCICY